MTSSVTETSAETDSTQFTEIVTDVPIVTESESTTSRERERMTSDMHETTERVKTSSFAVTSQGITTTDTSMTKGLETSAASTVPRAGHTMTTYSAGFGDDWQNTDSATDAEMTASTNRMTSSDDSLSTTLKYPDVETSNTLATESPSTVIREPTTDEQEAYGESSFTTNAPTNIEEKPTTLPSSIETVTFTKQMQTTDQSRNDSGTSKRMPTEETSTELPFDDTPTKSLKDYISKTTTILIPTKSGEDESMPDEILPTIGMPTTAKEPGMKECFQQGQIKARRYDVSNVGLPHYFKGWVDVQGQGAANDYCRVIHLDGERVLSCALAGTEGQSEHNYIANSDMRLGFHDTWFMRDMDGDGRDDYCRCLFVDKLQQPKVVCAKAGELGFYGSSEEGGSADTFILADSLTQDGRKCFNERANPVLGVAYAVATNLP
ncbi:PREDICTED: cell wall protein IFF6-like [Priapulus caudatus]|uniref:Cell wall protein IFF6-like n=1 Tax=Priapulus caudatus TaxID=37621 RepID=A0ABM1E674_PRICU|nr:PREDICTED: cell wall protein IFF6-like [Priapulus caudatus]